MDYFTEIPDANCIVLVNGVFRQSRVALRAGRLYARYGSGYVRLMQGGSSSHPKLRWQQIDTPDGDWREFRGYVEYSAPEVVTAVAAE